MWVKMVRKESLRETFGDAIKVEKEMSSLGTSLESREKKNQHHAKKEK